MSRFDPAKAANYFWVMRNMRQQLKITFSSNAEYRNLANLIREYDAKTRGTIFSFYSPDDFLRLLRGEAPTAGHTILDFWDGTAPPARDFVAKLKGLKGVHTAKD